MFRIMLHQVKVRSKDLSRLLSPRVYILVHVPSLVALVVLIITFLHTVPQPYQALDSCEHYTARLT